MALSAITSDNVARVKELLKNDPALAKTKDKDKQPVLQRMVTLDRREILVLLLNAGADANDSEAPPVYR